MDQFIGFIVFIAVSDKSIVDYFLTFFDSFFSALGAGAAGAGTSASSLAFLASFFF